MEPAGTHRDWKALTDGIFQDNILPRISNSSRLRASLVSKEWLKACSTKMVKKPGTCFLKLYRRVRSGEIFDDVQIHSPLHGEWYSGERVCWIGERSFECDGQPLQGGENGLLFVWRWPGGARRVRYGIEVVVYNPISDARRELPCLIGALCPDFLQMVPRAAEGGKGYSIMAVRRCLDKKGLAIFHSWTGSWRWCLARPAVDPEFKIQCTMRFSMEGNMLCLFGAAGARPPWPVKSPSIWSFDLEDEQWTEIATVSDKLLMPLKDCLNMKLVGGNGRVLLVITKGFCMQRPQDDEDEEEDEEDEEEEEEDDEDDEDDDEEGGRKKVKKFKYLGNVESVEVWELLHLGTNTTMPVWVCLSTMPDEYVEFMSGAFEMECNRINETTVQGKRSFHSITILDAEGCIYFCFDSQGHCNRLVQFDSHEKSWHWLDRCPLEMPDSYQFPRIGLFTMKPDKDAEP